MLEFTLPSGGLVGYGAMIAGRAVALCDPSHDMGPVEVKFRFGLPSASFSPSASVNNSSSSFSNSPSTRIISSSFSPSSSTSSSSLTPGPYNAYYAWPCNPCLSSPTPNCSNWDSANCAGFWDKNNLNTPVHGFRVPQNQDLAPLKACTQNNGQPFPRNTLYYKFAKVDGANYISDCWLLVPTWATRLAVVNWAPLLNTGLLPIVQRTYGNLNACAQCSLSSSPPLPSTSFSPSASVNNSSSSFSNSPSHTKMSPSASFSPSASISSSSSSFSNSPSTSSYWSSSSNPSSSRSSCALRIPSKRNTKVSVQLISLTSDQICSSYCPSGNANTRTFNYGPINNASLNPREGWVIDFDPHFVRWPEPLSYCRELCCDAQNHWSSATHYGHNDVVYVPCFPSCFNDGYAGSLTAWTANANYSCNETVRADNVLPSNLISSSSLSSATPSPPSSSGSSQASGGGGGGGNNPLFYHPMTDCSTQASLWGQSTSSSLSAGITVSYGVAPPYECAALNGGDPSATGQHLDTRAIYHEHNDCCDCNSSFTCRDAAGFARGISNGYPTYGQNGLDVDFWVQVHPQSGVPSDYKIFQHTKVSVETTLGGRAVETALISDFGVVTDCVSNGCQVTMTHGWAGMDTCFDVGAETLTYRIKVECGDVSTGSWVSCSTTYSDWNSVLIDHITGYGGSGNQQCTPLYEVNHCTGGGTSILDDVNGIGIAANDVVVWSVGGVNICGTVSQVHTGSQARVATVSNSSYQDCAACIVSNPLTEQGGTS